MRDFIARLEFRDELLRIKKEVDPLYEVAAIIFKLERGKSIVFENVKGYSIPIVGNLFNSRKKIALGLDTDERDILKKCVYGLDHPIEPVIVSAAPCKDVSHVYDVDLMKNLPIPTFFEMSNCLMCRCKADDAPIFT